MSNAEQTTNVSTPTDTAGRPTDAPQTAPVEDKGKGRVDKHDDAMDEDDDEDDDEDGENEDDVEEDDEMEDEDEYREINPEAILPPGRRTRGVKVDYTSAEALAKAGLDNVESVDADEEEEFKDDAVKTA